MSQQCISLTINPLFLVVGVRVRPRLMLMLMLLLLAIFGISTESEGILNMVTSSSFTS